jgi:carbon-monoxide dehydrogenase medium subunit
MDFEYHQPRSLDETFSLLEDHGDDALLIAGGTALVQFIKQRLAQPGHLISLARVNGLDGIVTNGEKICIGAMCSHRGLETSALVQKKIPLVSDTYRKVATPRIRNMATVGGGLVHGDPNQDPPPSLIALDASVVLTSSNGERIVQVEDFFMDYFQTSILPGEVLTELRVPVPPLNAGYAFLKFLPRTADDYATVSTAAVLYVGPGDICEDVRVAIGSAGVTPVRATAAESILRGQRLTDEVLMEASATVKAQVDPLDDPRGSADYKRDMAGVFTRRALTQAWQMVKAGQ